MRKYQHLDLLVKQNNGAGNKNEFSELLMRDLQQSRCMIYGENADEALVLLAELKIQLDTIKLNSGLFQQSIQFVVEGKIASIQFPAITYSVHGETCRFYGRCSTIPQICGVDLYLDKSYTEEVGAYVRQKFTIPVSKLYKAVK